MADRQNGEGFGASIAALDRCVVSPQQQATPCGRGYKVFDDVIFAGSIHVMSKDEDEQLHKRWQEATRAAPPAAGKIYGGIAGFLNLSFMAALRPEAAVLFDVNVAQTLFWRKVISELAENNNLAGFQKFMKGCAKQFPGEVATIFNAASGLTLHNQYFENLHVGIRDDSLLQGWLEHPGGADTLWMRDYGHIHEMARRDAIGVLTLDVLDDAACEQLRGQLLERPGRLFSHLYLGNVLKHMHGHHDWTCRVVPDATAGHARRNLVRLAAPDATIIEDFAIGNANDNLAL